MLQAGKIRDQSKPSDPIGDPLGHVHSVCGSQASIGLLMPGGGSVLQERTTVGRFIKIQTGNALLVAVVTEISMQESATARDQGYQAAARVDLMGEITQVGTDRIRFQRGVSVYPAIGDPIAPITNSELRIIFDSFDADTINIGHLQQDHGIGVYVDVDEMLSKHFAVLGTTGVGKSCAIALILQQILEARPNLRILLLDVHNEYGRCFSQHAQTLNPRNLKLPFWLFNFDEIVDAFFAGRPGLEEEVEILAEVIPLAKTAYTQYRSLADRLAIKKSDPKSMGFSVDTPVPYRLVDLLALIDERMGKLENRTSRVKYHKLISRIETISNDPRYAFMFENANVGGDTMAEVIGQLFRLPANDRPMTIMELAGFPAEVVDSVVSVLCRVAFDFGMWSDGATPLLFVCEEAHRYASADRGIGFGPTRRAISRIAKEGRKYGVFLGLVTQRPAELDPTIISQCSTLIAMRMSNDRDQSFLRSAVSDGAANLLAFVPSLGTREALAFGVGVLLPTRLTFKELPAELVPRGEALEGALPATGNDQNFIASVVERWRGATMSQRGSPEESLRKALAVAADAVPLQSPAAPDPNRSGLKKPPADRPEPQVSMRSEPPGQPPRWPSK
jgi:DNA helicase HerA-like ATPase